LLLAWLHFVAATLQRLAQSSGLTAVVPLASGEGAFDPDPLPAHAAINATENPRPDHIHARFMFASPVSSRDERLAERSRDSQRLPYFE